MSTTANYLEYTHLSNFPNTEAGPTELGSKLQALEIHRISGIIFVFPRNL